MPFSRTWFLEDLSLSKQVICYFSWVVVLLGYLLPSAHTVAVEVVKLSSGGSHDHFGQAVSVSGNYALVGAMYENSGGESHSGAAYVYIRNGSSWIFQQRLTASDAEPDDIFGVSVSISSDYAVIGAFQDDSECFDCGSAYVFERNGDTWTQKQKLTASDQDVEDYFAHSVSISGENIVVGSVWDDDGGIFSGSAYVYHLVGGIWTQQVGKLTPPVHSAYDYCGDKVSVSGNTAIVGCHGGNFDKGEAHIFVRVGNLWSHQQKLVGLDSNVDDNFGGSVSISADYAIIGARLNDADDGKSNIGSVYVFERTLDTWTQKAKLIASNPTKGENFGRSVDVSGEYAVVGAPFNGSGSVYYFQRNENGEWNEIQVITNTTDSPTDQFGMFVSISDGYAIFGNLESPNSSALVYEIIDCSKENDCSNHGICIGLQDCDCHPLWQKHPNCSKCTPGYETEDCSKWKCDGLESNHSKVCSAHGECISPDTCICEDTLYEGSFCGKWKCHYIYNTERYVCGGHGQCVDVGECICDVGYPGNDCMEWDCFGKNLNDTSICSQNGLCFDQNVCVCISGYHGAQCQYFECSNTNHTDRSGCNNHGTCIRPDMCNCVSDYEGQFCGNWSCGGYTFDHELVCRGRGECTKPETCICTKGYDGKICERDLRQEANEARNEVALAVSLSIAGAIALALVICIPVLVLVFVYVFRRVRKRLKKFEDIEDIDIIMRESEVEKMTGISFKINKKLFEVDFNDIKFKEKVGQGGGMATIWLVKYKEREMVFKSFQMTDFGDEGGYQEFENEVAVIGSVSHENILRFFGYFYLEFCVKLTLKNYKGCSERTESWAT